jgi:hypothetical protein
VPPLQKDYGSCCKDLKEALEFSDYHPLLRIAENGGLYVAVGYVETKDSGVGWFDQAVFFCPFCGTQLMTREELKAAEWPA